ncbi:uncharacterized protein [Salminus brasiliensis]|uniref:uncharacterized protein n=1 Tax=Salminus brasiliensis TaxID=930266 RepID=UPI003B832203
MAYCLSLSQLNVYTPADVTSSPGNQMKSRLSWVSTTPLKCAACDDSRAYAIRRTFSSSARAVKQAGGSPTAEGHFPARARAVKQAGGPPTAETRSELRNRAAEAKVTPTVSETRRHVVALSARQKFVVSDGEKISTNTDLLAGCGRCVDSSCFTRVTTTTSSQPLSPTNNDRVASHFQTEESIVERQKLRLGNNRSRWAATRHRPSPERTCLWHTESKGDAYGNLQFLIYKDIFVRRAIMTDGEGREHFHFLEGEEAQVPIAALYGNEEAKGSGSGSGSSSSSGGGGGGGGAGSGAWSTVPGSAEAHSSGAREPAPDLLSEEEEQPYPKHAAVVFFCLKQTTRPRSWCLRLVCNPYPFCSHLLTECFRVLESLESGKGCTLALRIYNTYPIS